MEYLKERTEKREAGKIRMQEVKEIDKTYWLRTYHKKIKMIESSDQ